MFIEGQLIKMKNQRRRITKRNSIVITDLCKGQNIKEKNCDVAAIYDRKCQQKKLPVVKQKITLIISEK